MYFPMHWLVFNALITRALSAGNCGGLSLLPEPPFPAMPAENIKK